MRIQVTQEHITNGRQKWCQLCPVALALGEALGTEVSITCTDFRIVSPPKTARKRHFKLPENVMLFISDFDCGRPVQPFEFELAFIPVEESI